MKKTFHFRKDKMLKIYKDNFMTATFAGVVIGKLLLFFVLTFFKKVILLHLTKKRVLGGNHKKEGMSKKGSNSKKGAINKIICFHSKTVLLVLKRILYNKLYFRHFILLKLVRGYFHFHSFEYSQTNIFELPKLYL